MANEEKKKSLLEAQIAKKSQSCDENRDLWNIVQNIVSDVEDHLRRISSQMPNYDIHDAEHSQEIIKIMGKILADKLKSLSFYELILLYLAAYLHDSGMALPDWEYDTLKIVEECDKHSPLTSQHKLKSDFQSSNKSDIAEKILEYLDFDYEKAKNYIFIEDCEEKVVENISDLIGKYESFRHEEIAKRNNTSYEDYKKLSEDIRYEFIRINHHKKAASNIKNLNNKIKACIGSFTEQFLEDLADICQAHCENIERVEELPKNDRIDWESNDKNNIQFLAEMLRLGDIIHFSSDRAPRSLFSEKLITDERSIKHWKAKEGVKCQILRDKDRVKISFHAFCSKPEMYYFLADYIKEIESEISNFDELKKDWEPGKKYNVNIHRKVTDKIECSDFKPDSKLKFSMDQSKILELLMGVQLYQDKFACLREVYQNALDTSKCLLAYNKSKGISEEINIEFGVGEEEIEGIKRKYIYCLDHGLGMSKEIIKKYLLHIGNSYYNSGDFAATNIDWGNNVIPTSQFGIGILSCYMIADKIGISTVYYKDGKQTSFVLSEVSERFYYKKNFPTEDAERIGKHGTIVKLYLKDDEDVHIINSDYIPEMESFLAGSHDLSSLVYDEELFGKVTVKIMDNNLFYILFKYIGIPHSEIPVYINTSDGKKDLYYYNKVFNYRDVATEEYVNKLKDYYLYFEEYIKNIDFFENDVVKTKTENIELYTLLSLPKKGISEIYVNMLGYISFLRNNSLCVDGIAVENTRGMVNCLGFNKDLLSHTIVNFCGENRPKLSIDRNSCEFPKFSDDELAKLKADFLLSIENKIKNHLSKEGINSKDKEFLLIYQFLSSQYPSIASTLLADIVDTSMFFPDAGLNMLKISDILFNPEIEIKKINFQNYWEISRQLVLGKCIESDLISIVDENLYIKSSVKHNFDNISSLSTFAIRADKWDGKYKDYDLVTSIWPIVNPNLFDKLTTKRKQNKISSHCKIVDSYANGINAIALLDPTLINLNGIGERRRFLKDKLMINQDIIRKNFRLSELSNYGETIRNEKKSPTLFAYIAPRELSDSEKVLLEARRQTDPEYVRGVKEGWSIYFLGRMQEYIIVPGIISRADMENKIPPKYKTITPDISYFDTNDKIVIQAKNGDKNKK